jgi:hypothetical protein
MFVHRPLSFAVIFPDISKHLSGNSQNHWENIEKFGSCPLRSKPRTAQMQMVRVLAGLVCARSRL